MRWKPREENEASEAAELHTLTVKENSDKELKLL